MKKFQAKIILHQMFLGKTSDENECDANDYQLSKILFKLHKASEWPE